MCKIQSLINVNIANILWEDSYYVVTELSELSI